MGIQNTLIISIHSLRMEGDVPFVVNLDGTVTFQSTPSAWRETFLFCQSAILLHISIHSLRMEGDSGISTLVKQALIISIHSLRMEGDQNKIFVFFRPAVFQSTPSAWRETED